jgi:hypothetical protein
MKTVWKWIIITFALVLAAVTLYSFWPYWTASRAMQTFCERITPGMAAGEVDAKAAEFGYSVTATTADSKQVDDPVSFGRLKCTVRFDARGVAAAEYSGIY